MPANGMALTEEYSYCIEGDTVVESGDQLSVLSLAVIINNHLRIDSGSGIAFVDKLLFDLREQFLPSLNVCFSFGDVDEIRVEKYLPGSAHMRGQ